MYIGDLYQIQLFFLLLLFCRYTRHLNAEKNYTEISRVMLDSESHRAEFGLEKSYTLCTSSMVL